MIHQPTSKSSDECSLTRMYVLEGCFAPMPRSAPSDGAETWVMLSACLGGACPFSLSLSCSSSFAKVSKTNRRKAGVNKGETRLERSEIVCRIGKICICNVASLGDCERMMREMVLRAGPKAIEGARPRSAESSRGRQEVV